jgi:hypothetical protein
MTAFTDDPLAPPSSQFPLARPGWTAPEEPERPSGPSTRPFGLRFMRTAPTMRAPGFRYSHALQMSVTADRPDIPMIDRAPMMEWSTITNNDGDEGPSEDFGNDYCPDQTIQP